ncbi:MAG TPA: peptide ABC transporter substrate-binding protein [Dehalococcoidia bacterium]|nr:peptide ABC transporter substrate-binding protein [Dehalococcoidia bacterium]
MSLVKQWRYLLLTLVALVAVAACGDDDDDDDTGAPTATGDATETDAPADGDRIQGGDLAVHGHEFASLDPHFSSFAQDISLHRMLWRGLYWLDADNNVTPGMAAEDPDISEDGLTYTITLRDGLLWSDGEPLTAADFALGIQRTCNPDNAGQYQYVLNEVAGCNDYYGAYGSEAEPLEPTEEELQALLAEVGVEATDDTTLVITLSTPKPTFPIILSLWMTFPVPSHLVPDPGQEWPTDPAGLAYNGPYVLTEYTPQDHVTLIPNENWAAPNDISPTLDTLTIRFIDDYAVANDAYRTSEVLFARADTAVLSSVVSEFGEGDQYFKAGQPSTRGLQMNLEVAPLDNLEVRLAVSQALDRDAISNVAADGANDPTTSWIPAAAVPGGDEPDAFEECCGFNPEAAQAHLETAGYPGGEGFPDLDILIGDNAVQVAVAEVIQQSLQQNLNITVGIEVVDAATRSARFTSEDYELFLGGWIQDYPDPENWIVGLYDTDGPINHTNCSDPDIDALISENISNTDNDARVQAYNDVNALISERVCGIAPYWHENLHYLIAPEVVGMRENIAGQDAFQAGDWIAEAWGLSE